MNQARCNHALDFTFCPALESPPPAILLGISVPEALFSLRSLFVRKQRLRPDVDVRCAICARRIEPLDRRYLEVDPKTQIRRYVHVECRTTQA